jgi:hypothetical protein
MVSCCFKISHLNSVVATCLVVSTDGDAQRSSHGSSAVAVVKIFYSFLHDGFHNACNVVFSIYKIVR